ncbi:unnamed protein product [Pseudo-nitzschia multistriata]|uniref:Palmitoyltransferase n=1 Tax=Pseudo-nitzschia multistriata TaxID=183589 RepID=A0A448ZGP4_9STRA|nr:unnamed protein product [Pseudo-nitzschia multistriata]
MASQETRQRKGGAPPKSGDAGLPMTITKSAGSAATGVGGTANHLKLAMVKPVVKMAKVKRNKFGTGPFDEHWLNLDCCGLFCASFTYMLHAYGVYATCLILIPPWMSTVDEDGVRTISAIGHLNRVAFTLVALLAVWAHFKAMTTNPGAVPPDAIPLEEANNPDTGANGEGKGDGKNSSLMVEDSAQPPPRKGRRLCRRCNSFKPKRAHHCSICKRCVVKMDHHCPWVNNCVGIGNHKYFLLFIFYTCLSCVYSLTLVLMRFFDCMGRHGHIRTHHITCLDRPTQLMNILGLVVEAILFGLFTCCMMFDQASVVTTNLTQIDRLKGGIDGGSSGLAGAIEVFGLNPKKNDTGGRFRPDWLSPFHHTCFPSSLQDEIMGFCRPCGSRRGNGKDSGDTEMSPMVRNGVADIV